MLVLLPTQIPPSQACKGRGPRLQASDAIRLRRMQPIPPSGPMLSYRSLRLDTHIKCRHDSGAHAHRQVLGDWLTDSLVRGTRIPTVSEANDPFRHPGRRLLYLSKHLVCDLLCHVIASAVSSCPLLSSGLSRAFKCTSLLTLTMSRKVWDGKATHPPTGLDYRTRGRSLSLGNPGTRRRP